MRKVVKWITVFLLIVSLFIPAVAMASDGSPPDEFFTWGYLATYAGCWVGTMIVTQFAKPLWPVKWDTRYLSFLIALLLLIAANWALGTLTWEFAGLSVLNAVLVTFAANGGFDFIKGKVASVKKQE